MSATRNNTNAHNGARRERHGRYFCVRCCAATMIGVMALGGCSRDPMVQVAGLVEIDSAALPDGTIQFLPADGHGPSAEAAIRDGKYQVALMPGVKKVVIYGYQVVGELHPWGKNAPSVPQRKSIVPARYNERTELTKDIRAADGELHFKLQSR